MSLVDPTHMLHIIDKQSDDDHDDDDDGDENLTGSGAEQLVCRLDFLVFQLQHIDSQVLDAYQKQADIVCCH